MKLLARINILDKKKLIQFSFAVNLGSGSAVLWPYSHHFDLVAHSQLYDLEGNSFIILRDHQKSSLDKLKSKSFLQNSAKPLPQSLSNYLLREVLFYQQNIPLLFLLSLALWCIQTLTEYDLHVISWELQLKFTWFFMFPPITKNK